MSETKNATQVDELDEQDIELKKIMGDRFIDATQIPAKSKNPTPSKAKKVVDAQWEPAEPNTSWVEKLKSCVLWAVGFGGLNMLIFYWQQAGLMDPSVAIPCMWVCCALAGYGIGKNSAKGDH